MGIDRAIHVEVSDADFAQMQPFHVSKILAKIAQEEKADVLILGKQVSSRFKISKYRSCLFVVSTQTPVALRGSPRIRPRTTAIHCVHITTW